MLLKQNHPQQPQLIAIWRTEPVFISQLSMANGWIFWTKKCKQNSNVPFWNIRTTSRCCMQGGRINTTRCSFLPPFSCHNIDPWPKTGRSLVTSAASVLLVLCPMFTVSFRSWLLVTLVTSPWLPLVYRQSASALVKGPCIAHNELLRRFHDFPTSPFKFPIQDTSLKSRGLLRICEIFVKVRREL